MASIQVFDTPLADSSSSSDPSSFDESSFSARIDSSLSTIKTLISNLRNPTRPSEVPHKYDDKYSLSISLTNTLLCSLMNTFELLGIFDDKKTLTSLVAGVAAGRSLLLHFSSTESCNFIKEATRRVDSTVEYVYEYSNSSGSTSSSSSKTTLRITEYFWSFEVKWDFSLSFGDDIEKKIPLNSKKCQRESKMEIITIVKETPFPKVSVKPTRQEDLTWLIRQLKEEKKGDTHVNFEINRENSSCRTPRRNIEVDSIITKSLSLKEFLGEIYNYLKNIFAIEIRQRKKSPFDMQSISHSEIFDPIVPLMESKETIGKKMKNEGKVDEKSMVVYGHSGAEESKSSPPLLSSDDIHKFLNKQKESLENKTKIIEKTFPSPSKGNLISSLECSILIYSLHVSYVVSSYVRSQNYIEYLLYSQLISAIGKIVTPYDFDKYIIYHHRKIFSAQYAPQLFSYAVRRSPLHSAEGEVTILAKGINYAPIAPIFNYNNNNNNNNNVPSPSLSPSPSSSPLSDLPTPALTHTRKFPPANTLPITFPINASTRITANGSRYIHTLVTSEFEGKPTMSFDFVARSRQFSSFIVLIGTMETSTSFLPVASAIVQNKDELTIPLLLESLPSAKVFQDHISSMSPQQQRFAKAIRAMQLDSSMFGILVIQIKPQLEKCLNLPYDSLTKHIQLTEDLLEIFRKYKIPTDLLTCEKQEEQKTIGEGEEKEKELKKQHGDDEKKGVGVNDIEDEDGYIVVNGDDEIETVQFYVEKVQEIIQREKDRQLSDRSLDASYALSSPTPISTGSFFITVKTLTGKSISLLVTSIDSVGMLKDHISIKEGIPNDQQRLIFNKTMLKDNMVMRDYGITAGCTVFLVLRLRGGTNTDGDGWQTLTDPLELSQGGENEWINEPICGMAGMSIFGAIGGSIGRGARGGRGGMGGAATANNNNNNNNNNNAVATATNGAVITTKNTPSAGAGAPSSPIKGVDLLQGTHDDDDDDNAPSALLSDFTSLPRVFDSTFLSLDTFQRTHNEYINSSIHNANIRMAPMWKLKHYQSLLSPAVTNDVDVEQQKKMKNEAYDLLDSLTRSGVLSLDYCEFHCLVGVSHNFHQSLVNFIIQGNQNPIELIDRSHFAIAEVLHEQTMKHMVKKSEWKGLVEGLPMLESGEEGEGKGKEVEKKK